MAKSLNTLTGEYKAVQFELSSIYPVKRALEASEERIKLEMRDIIYKQLMTTIKRKYNVKSSGNEQVSGDMWKSAEHIVNHILWKAEI